MNPKPFTALNHTIFPRIAACLPFEGAPSARSWEPRVAGHTTSSGASVAKCLRDRALSAQEREVAVVAHVLCGGCHCGNGHPCQRAADADASSAGVDDLTHRQTCVGKHVDRLRRVFANCSNLG